jgi:hypothetical protein
MILSLAQGRLPDLPPKTTSHLLPNQNVSYLLPSKAVSHLLPNLVSTEKSAMAKAFSLGTRPP